MASLAIESDMTEQPLNLTLVLPENSADCEADGLSASTQAFEASVISATALACSGTFVWVKMEVNIRSRFWLRMTSTAFLAVFGPDAGGVLTTMVPAPSPFELADVVAAAVMAVVSEPAIFSSAPA